MDGNKLVPVVRAAIRRPGIVRVMLLAALVTRVVLAQPEGPDWIRAISWNPSEDKIAYATQYGRVVVVEASSGLPDFSLIPSVAQALYSLVWSPDGSKLAAGGSRHVIDIWDAADGQLLLTLDLAGEARSIAWSPDGMWLAVAGQEGVPFNVQVRNVMIGEVEFSPIVGEALAVAWSPDSTTLAIAKLGEIQLWDISTQTFERTISTQEYVLSLDWNHDGTQIASASIYVPDSPSIKIWDVESGSLLQVFVDQRGSINHVGWDTSSTRLISASTDKSIRIWDAITGQVLQSVVTRERAYAADFSPFGGRIAVGAGVMNTDLSGVEILVPDPSLERLNSIVQACISAEGQRGLTLASDTAQLSAFVEQLETLTDAQIPPSCRADLLAIVGAIRGE